jgi:adenosine deaminase
MRKDQHMTWHDRIPKVELHVHLEGAIPHEALFALIQKYGGDPSVPDVAALAKRFEYKNFVQFIEAWSWKNQFLHEYEDFTHIAKLTAQDMAAQGIRYAEMFFSPSLFVRHHGVKVQELTRAVRTGLSQVPEIEVALIADLVRDYGPESEMRTLLKLAEVKESGVIGIGIGGSEHEYPPAPFKNLYEKARSLDLHTTAHAGEAEGCHGIWEAVRELRVERIGHGTSAWQDPALLAYLAGHHIPLELCPVSNVRTRAVKSLAEHPTRQYFEAGVTVSVNSDDPKMFQTSLADEYRLLEQVCGCTKAEICRLIVMAVDASWLPEERKQSLAAEVRKHPDWGKDGVA